MRTISLDARCGSPASTDVTDLRTPSPSQSSLASIAGGSVVSNISMNSAKVGRCLSPLLIPPRTPAGVDPAIGPSSPLGALQPDLYRVPDGPIYLTAPESSPALGRLHLRVKYDYHLFDLTVHLIEGVSYYYKYFLKQLNTVKVIFLMQRTTFARLRKVVFAIHMYV